MSNRRSEWDAFAYKVGKHIDEYTVKQYGDYPDDKLTEYSIDSIVQEIKKYCARVHTNARGRDETMRDTLKIAHYAAVLHSKLQEERWKNQET